MELCVDLFSVEDEFFRLVFNIIPELRDKKSPDENWSPKDILAHIVGWEVEVVKQFKEFLVNPDVDEMG